MNPTQPPPFWTSVLPICFLMAPLLILMIFISKRKGQSIPIYIILGLVPGVNILAAIWLASQTDASVLTELQELKRSAAARKE